MRRLKVLFALTVGLIVMTVAFSCSDDDDGALLSVDKRDIAFTAEGGTETFTIHTDLTGWEVLVYGVWFKTKIQDGNKIVIEAEENTTERVRTGIIEITHEQLSSSVFVNLSQDAATVVPPAVYTLKSAEADNSMGIFFIEFVNAENSNEVISLRGMSAVTSDGFLFAEGSYSFLHTSGKYLSPGSAAVGNGDEIVVYPSYHAKLTGGEADIADCSFFKSGIMEVTWNGRGSYSVSMYFESTGLEYDESTGEFAEIEAPLPVIEASFTGIITFSAL